MKERYSDADKKIVMQYCIRFIKTNGYIRVGYAVDQAVKDKEFDGAGHRAAFINSVSSMLVNTGEYIREETKQLQDDYDILLNPNYFLNKSVMSTNRVTRIIAYIAVVISAMTLIQQLTQPNEVHVPELESIKQQLKNQEQVLNKIEINLRTQIVTKDSINGESK